MIKFIFKESFACLEKWLVKDHLFTLYARQLLISLLLGHMGVAFIERRLSLLILFIIFDVLTVLVRLGIQ
jgi:hypothetical protein